MLSGTLAYSTLKANLPYLIPSISTVRTCIDKFKAEKNIFEGVLRCKELKEYLINNNLPLFVSVSEDATSINNRVQYDKKTNQLVGFVLPLNENGMPMSHTYLARSVSEIEEHFLKHSDNISKLVNVVMAQPLVNGYPAFCILIYGTNNAYKAKTVSQRWNFIKNELYKWGIHVVAFSSDSDPRYNTSMRIESGLGMNSSGIFPDVEWFNCSKMNDTVYIQDTEHIGTKLRNILLKTRNKLDLKIGNAQISVNHLDLILQNFSKDKHNLNPTTLNPLDKQNFDSVKRLYDERVLKLLSTEIPNSLGTVLFLKALKNIIDSYRDPNLSPEQRVYKIWHAVFIFRFWRQSIMEDPNMRLKDNFITVYTYVCIELNAHSMVSLILYLRSKNLPELFLPLLLGSQQCEKAFRQVRSITSAYYTATNCTLFEFMSRIGNTEFQNYIAYKALPDFNFPRIQDKFKNARQQKHFELPNEQALLNIIEAAKMDAIQDLKPFKLSPSVFESCNFTLNSMVHKDINLEENPPLGESDIENSENLNTSSDQKDKLSSIKDAELRDYSIEKRINLNCLPPTAPFVKIILDSGKTIVVKKSSLCWIFTKDKTKVSTDRLLRVASRQASL